MTEFYVIRTSQGIEVAEFHGEPANNAHLQVIVKRWNDDLSLISKGDIIKTYEDFDEALIAKLIGEQVEKDLRFYWFEADKLAKKLKRQMDFEVNQAILKE